MILGNTYVTTKTGNDRTASQDTHLNDADQQRGSHDYKTDFRRVHTTTTNNRGRGQPGEPKNRPSDANVCKRGHSGHVHPVAETETLLHDFNSHHVPEPEETFVSVQVAAIRHQEGRVRANLWLSLRCLFQIDHVSHLRALSTFRQRGPFSISRFQRRDEYDECNIPCRADILHRRTVRVQLQLFVRLIQFASRCNRTSYRCATFRRYDSERSPIRPVITVVSAVTRAATTHLQRSTTIGVDRCVFVRSRRSLRIMKLKKVYTIALLKTPPFQIY